MCSLQKQFIRILIHSYDLLFRKNNDIIITARYSGVCLKDGFLHALFFTFLTILHSRRCAAHTTYGFGIIYKMLILLWLPIYKEHYLKPIQ